MVKAYVALGLIGTAAIAVIVGVLGYAFLRPAEAASGPIQTTPVAQLAGGNGTVYTIDQAVSQANFSINEVLNGAPKTVVGTTNQVAGQIAADLKAPKSAQIGTIQINARTLTTDSDSRNNAIKNQILKTNDHEFITFAPTSLVGLPESATVGQSYSFQIVGQLTIAGQTREATFNATVTPTAANALQGTATATIKYTDWGISIPSVPFVTGVEENVVLTIAFVAKAQ
jgi:polyisoprenoid-binding protein YceI